MNFTTKVEIPKPSFTISHHDKLMMMGSCFAENIGSLLQKNKFLININPFGILYNPLSIEQVLRFVIDEKQFTIEDLFQHDGLYHSFYHHSRFSNASCVECLASINNGLSKATENLRNVDVLLITFGTSYVFRSKQHDIIVGNCHKLPASHFERYRISVNDIVEKWDQLIFALREMNPKLKIVFTVSPIRHMKDGAHDNQLSKSTLLLAIDQLCNNHPSVSYFPSYEIVMDELRDYRFYKEDMIHPSDVAVQYIWQRFSDAYFSKDAISIVAEWAKLATAIHHKSFNPDSEQHQNFLKQTLLKLKTFADKHPYIYCKNEIDDLTLRIH